MSSLRYDMTVQRNVPRFCMVCQVSATGASAVAALVIHMSGCYTTECIVFLSQLQQKNRHRPYTAT